MDGSAPLLVDGFVGREGMAALRARGAVGEITCWVYDRNGQLIETEFSRRVASAPLPKPSAERRVIAVATGQAKVPAICGALSGGLISALITGEATAGAVLAAEEQSSS